MGDQRNNLRHLGMIATSGSWRRHWLPPHRQAPRDEMPPGFLDKLVRVALDLLMASLWSFWRFWRRN